MSRERRKFHRVSESLEGRCRASGQLSALGAAITILNFSAGGLRFRGEELHEKDAFLEIETQMPGMKDKLLLKAQVAWSSLHASGVVETGVEFLDVTGDQQYQIDNLVAFFRLGRQP